MYWTLQKDRDNKQYMLHNGSRISAATVLCNELRKQQYTDVRYVSARVQRPIRILAQGSSGIDHNPAQPQFRFNEEKHGSKLLLKPQAH
jgi:hypothetical protein